MITTFRKKVQRLEKGCPSRSFLSLTPIRPFYFKTHSSKKTQYFPLKKKYFFMKN